MIKALALAAGLVALSAGAAAPIAANAVIYQTTFQGATFVVAPTSSNSFLFGIVGSNAMTGNWAGANYLGAFAFNSASIGGGSNVTATLINPATGQATAAIDGGLNASGCNGTGNFICFNLSPNVAVAPLLVFNVVTTGTFAYEALGPDLKIDWSLSSSDDTHVGDLFSARIPVCVGDNCGGPVINPLNGVPEPATWAMMILGMGMVGIGLRLRRRAAEKALA